VPSLEVLALTEYNKVVVAVLTLLSVAVATGTKAKVRNNENNTITYLNLFIRTPIRII
jgi:hypothetical protein